MVADSLLRLATEPGNGVSPSREGGRVSLEALGIPNVDAIATRFNFKLKAFFSPVPALGLDAFLQNWLYQELYLYPPTKLIRKVLAKFLASMSVRAIFIAPLGTKETWYPDLLNLIVNNPRHLPLGESSPREAQFLKVK